MIQSLQLAKFYQGHIAVQIPRSGCSVLVQLPRDGMRRLSRKVSHSFTLSDARQGAGRPARASE